MRVHGLLGADDDGARLRDEVGGFPEILGDLLGLLGDGGDHTPFARENRPEIADMHLPHDPAHLVEGDIDPSHPDEGSLPAVNGFRDADHVDFRAPLVEIRLSHMKAPRRLRPVVPVLGGIVKIVLEPSAIGPCLAVDPDIRGRIAPILVIENHVEAVHRRDRAVFQQGGQPVHGHAPLFFIRKLGGADDVRVHRHPVHEIVHRAHFVMDFLERLTGSLLQEELPSAVIVGKCQHDEDQTRAGSDGHCETLADRAGVDEVFQGGHHVPER